MGNLNRNRLIGGGVLLLASLLFVPAILTPTRQPLSNPDLPAETAVPNVIVGGDSAAKKDKTAAKVGGLSLESVADEKNVDDKKTMANQAADNENITKAEDLLPKSAKEKTTAAIHLESVSTEKTTAPTLKTSKQERWVRVGSFSNLKNADKLAAALQRKKYPVKIENIKVSGKPYRRVLVGPFASDKEMRRVLNQIQSEGLSPRIQQR